MESIWIGCGIIVFTAFYAGITSLGSLIQMHVFDVISKSGSSEADFFAMFACYFFYVNRFFMLIFLLNGGEICCTTFAFVQ